MNRDLFEYLKNFISEDRLAVFEQVIAERTRHFTVVTEDIFQIHNTSAVMRSCDVFGIQDLHVIEERFGQDIDTEISLGAQKWVNLYRYQNAETCLKTLKQQGYQLIATTPNVDSQFLEDFDISKKTAFLFGTERDGLSEKVMAQADGFLKIPMYGFSRSLNISVSAAIILQSVVSRLKASPVSWQLSEEEQISIQIEWMKNTIKASEAIIERYYQELKNQPE